MSRILILAVVGLLLFGGLLAADQMLQNPDVEPADADDAADQEAFVEATTPFVNAAAPVVMFALIIALMLVGARAAGAG